MSNENSQNGTPMNATTADAPPPPAANGSSNGATSHASAEPPANIATPNTETPPVERVESAAQAGHATTATSSKKDRRRDRKKARNAQSATSSDTASATAANTAPDTAPVADATIVSTADATPAEVPTAAAPTADAAPTEVPTVAAPTVAAPAGQPQPTSPTSEQPVSGAPPITTQEGGLRLRMKVWTDPETLKRYLVATAFMRDMVNGQPVSDIMRAYATSEDDTRVITLRVAEWNTLPFYYFQEDGPAPRASRRPVDRIG